MGEPAVLMVAPALRPPARFTRASVPGIMLAWNEIRTTAASGWRPRSDAEATQLTVRQPTHHDDQTLSGT
jgi:hypothetical protein